MAERKDWAMDYIDVATRIVEFREKHPQGSLQQVAVQFLDFAGSSWVVYTAAAYRTPDDERPGHGTAWEPVPGKTNFTRDSELQNAETAAFGRAIVAALAADTRKGIASAEEVRNRRTENVTAPAADDPAVLRASIAAEGKRLGLDVAAITADFTEWSTGKAIQTADPADLASYLDSLKRRDVAA